VSVLLQQKLRELDEYAALGPMQGSLPVLMHLFYQYPLQILKDSCIHIQSLPMRSRALCASDGTGVIYR
jgi:hypothetical protein